MEVTLIPLSMLPIGSKGKVKNLKFEGYIRRRILDLGIVNDSIIEVVRTSPIGDPTAYLIKGSLIGLRKSDAEQVLVAKIY